MLTHILKFFVFLVPLIIFLVVGALYVWSDMEISLLISSVASIASLLTAMAAFVFGAYQVSKDERKVDFIFSVSPDDSEGQGVLPDDSEGQGVLPDDSEGQGVLPDDSEGQGVSSDDSNGQGASGKKTGLRIINTGQKPIYINNFAFIFPSHNRYPVVIKIVLEEKSTYMQRCLNWLRDSWYADTLQTDDNNKLSLMAIGGRANDHSSGNRIFVLEAGKDLSFYISNHGYSQKKEKWLSFLKKGKNFYIEDIECKRYYIPKRKVKRIKKDLEI